LRASAILTDARCSTSTDYSAICAFLVSLSLFGPGLTDGTDPERYRYRLPRSLANMRTVLSHYQTLLDDYRTPSGSFRDMMCSAHHRGFLEDHRSVT
jgi:hypothetical protein